MRTLCCAVLCLLIAACGDPFGSSNSDTQNNSAQSEELREMLREYNTELVASTESASQVTLGWGGFDAARQLNDPDSADTVLDRLTPHVDAFEASSLRLAEIEESIVVMGAAPNAVGPFALFAAGVAAYGLYKSAVWTKERSDEMNEIRQRRDDATRRGDDTAAQDAQSEMWDKGGEVIEDLGANLVVKGVPGNPTTVIGVLIKDDLSNQIKDGLVTVAVKPKCQESFTDPDCLIVLGETAGGIAPVATPGPVTVVIGGDDDARIAIPQLDPATTTEVVRESIPVDESTPTSVRQNDSGEMVTPANNVTPNNVSPNNNPTVGDGIFPNTPFNGLQIEYTVEGATLLDEVDETQDGAMTRSYEMSTLTADTVVISGTVTSFNNHSGELDMDPHAEVDITLTDGTVMEKVEDESGSTTGTWTRPFRLEIDASNAFFVQFLISGYWANGSESYTVVVGGNLIRQQ